MSHERRGCPSCGTWFDTIPRLTQALAEAEAALEEAKIKLTNARATTRVDGRTDAATQHIAAILKDAHSAYDTIRQALSTIRAAGGGRGHE